MGWRYAAFGTGWKITLWMPALARLKLAEKLTSFRAEDEGYICDSFATIAGFRDNGAIVHYRAIKGHDKVLDTDGVLLAGFRGALPNGYNRYYPHLFLWPCRGIPARGRYSQASYVLAAHIELAGRSFRMAQPAPSWMRFAGHPYGRMRWISGMAPGMGWAIFCLCMKGLFLSPSGVSCR